MLQAEIKLAVARDCNQPTISSSSKKNAIAKHREVMGATNPADAAEGTIRKVHATSLGENSVHGSDAPETAKEEIAYWFSETEIVG